MTENNVYQSSSIDILIPEGLSIKSNDIKAWGGFMLRSFEIYLCF
jgi:hypothetical protein